MDSLSKILVIDDEPAHTVRLEEILRAEGYLNIASCNDSRNVFELMERLQPDLIMLDLHMPAKDGFEILEEIIPDDEVRLPVLVLTSDTSIETRRKALAGGADDFLNKPFDAIEVGLRVDHLLRNRRLEIAARDHRQQLERRVAAGVEDVHEANRETIYLLALAAEHRDESVGEHIFRVAWCTGVLADESGEEPAVSNLYRTAAALHDVGKITIPDSILLKGGPLTDEEREVIKRHTLEGHRLLVDGRTPILKEAAEIALSHHEHWDGSGYPHGLAGTDIRLSGRIVGVADVFDALTQDRTYKKAWPVEDAVEEIGRLAGISFDPRLVEAFMRLDHETLATTERRRDWLDAS